MKPEQNTTSYKLIEHTYNFFKLTIAQEHVGISISQYFIKFTQIEGS